LLRVIVVSFLAELVATTGLTMVTVLGAAWAGVITGAFAATAADLPGCAVPVPVAATVLVPGVAAVTAVAFPAFGAGRLDAGAGFFEAIVPVAVAVSTAGPGDVADAHGSAVCAPVCGAAFLWWKSDVMPDTAVAAVATVEVAWPAAFCATPEPVAAATFIAVPAAPPLLQGEAPGTTPAASAAPLEAPFVRPSK
jgi:hypothetical protein